MDTVLYKDKLIVLALICMLMCTEITVACIALCMHSVGICTMDRKNGCCAFWCADSSKRMCAVKWHAVLGVGGYIGSLAPLSNVRIV